MAILVGSERPRPSQSEHLKQLDRDHQVCITLVVRDRPDGPPLPDLAYWQKTPLRKRRFATPAEYAELYGAAQSDVDAVTDFVEKEGLVVLDKHAGRRCVSVRGTAAQMEATFGVQLNLYECLLPHQYVHLGAKESGTRESQVYYGYDGPVHLPLELVGLVAAVVGLDNRRIADTPGPHLPLPAGASPPPPPLSDTVSAIKAAQLYNFPNLQAKDQTIGISAPQVSPGSYASYLASDIINNYIPSLGPGHQTLPDIHDVNCSVGGQVFSNNPTNVQQYASQSPGVQGWIRECTLDISISAAVSQGARINVYFTENSEQGLLAMLSRILQPEGNETQPTVVTLSWLVTDKDDAATIGSMSNTASFVSNASSMFQRLAAQGIPTFVALGDWGAADLEVDNKAHVSYPGSDPWVMSCGGTTLNLHPTPVPPGQPLFDEVVWNTGPNRVTGGGVSEIFPIPDYQTAAGITVVLDSNNTPLYRRFVPDVAGTATGFSGLFLNGTQPGSLGGTSAVAPFYAGFTALLHSAFGAKLGLLHPMFYQLRDSAFNDIVTGNNNTGTTSAPFFKANSGYDACTGLGSIDGLKLLNGIASQLYTPSMYFAVDKSTYGLDQVRNVSFYPTAFWIVLEGFTPQAVGPAQPMLSNNFFNLTGVDIQVGAGQQEIPSQIFTPQRIVFPCSIRFSAVAIATQSQGGIFPAGAPPLLSVLSASMTVTTTQSFRTSTIFELISGENPYFTNINPSLPNVFYLSQDLRVFTVTPGRSVTPIPGAPAFVAPSKSIRTTNSGFQYIQSLLKWLDSNFSDPMGPDPFTLFPDQSSAFMGDSSVAPSSPDPAAPLNNRFINYNFAVARVRLTGSPNSSSNKNVRVFFRLFASLSCDTDYNQFTTYPVAPPGTPLLGNAGLSIPFFATGNYIQNGDYTENSDYSADSVNNKRIDLGSRGDKWTYFGCYLNVYPTNNTTEDSSTGKSILEQLVGTHHCLVAEISFPDTPIVNSNGVTESPENCDKLAQRNIQITLSDNPGPASTHRIPQMFDVRPSPEAIGPQGSLLDYPDELMIDWGDTPEGSKASVYWPQAAASDILTTAKQLYSTHQLSALDDNTIQCIVQKGRTYVPIPSRGNSNLASLFTVDLPIGVSQGQIFNITVRRIASRRFELDAPRLLEAGPETANISPRFSNWRYVVGTFGVQIPVTTGDAMLPIEEDTLAIMKWRLEKMSPTNRWYPVLLRYISYISGRVDGLGGNSGGILPSPTGWLPTPQPRDVTGKIIGVIYDRFGDFEGFILANEEGVNRTFRSRENNIEKLVRSAWEKRMLITVISEAPSEIPMSIILRHVSQSHHH